jgi:serpin B
VSAPPAAKQEPTTGAPRGDLAQRNNAFAVDFYAAVRAQSGNLVMSPFSISTALTMTWAGARGETAAQMAKVLHLGLDVGDDGALDDAGARIKEYGAAGNKVTLRVANRLFGQKGHPFEIPYLTRIQGAFGAPLEPLDFKTAIEPSRDHINAWVAHETRDHIKDLIPPGGIDDTARLVLTNAVYFAGDWAVAFDRKATHPAPFFTGRDEKKNVPTMHQETMLRFAATGGVKVLEMPYVNHDLAMTIVLPDAIDGLSAVEARLTPAALDAWTRAAAPVPVRLSLPRLKLAPQQSLSLRDTLSAMGMPLAFSASQADFTGISHPAASGERLSLGGIFHKAFLTLDEKGTEAAAATAVVVLDDPSAVGPVELKVDHPFLFFLRDTRTGLVLFMGRVADPS